MSDRQAWFCPSCQKHHGPHVDTCPEPATPKYDPMPYEGWTGRDGTVPDPCAGCKGACGNVACPKRMDITCGGVSLPSDSNMIVMN